MRSKAIRVLRKAQCGAAEKVAEDLKGAASASDAAWQVACGTASIKFAAIGIPDLAVTVAQVLVTEPPERREECVAGMIEGIQNAKAWFTSQ
jgi:hypothetical protein